MSSNPPDEPDAAPVDLGYMSLPADVQRGLEAGPDQVAVTPGRAACETFWAAVVTGTTEPGAAWEWARSQKAQRAWESAATAAADADPRWPRCPDGCGCRMGTDDADGRDCGDCPCSTECRENGYPDAPSYRDLAVKAVYRERARLVAFLAACYGCTLAYGEDGDEWPAVFIETPAGQMSWHLAEADVDLFRRLGPLVTVAESHWDGHTTEVKYERLGQMADRIHLAGGLAGIIASMARPERAEPYPTAVERDELRAALSSLADRAEASRAITADEADEYRKLTGLEADRG